MEGVTILATEATGDKAILLFSIIVLGIITLILLIAAFLAITQDAYGLFILFGLFSVLVGAIFGTLLDGHRDWDENEHIRYIVTIDDSVGFKEFDNKYDVIEVNGDLYTIKERE